MAIYHFGGQVISRSQGRSVVASAAYRAGEKLHDDRLDKTFDYQRKEHVEHTEILLPKEAPAWMAEREKLWNAVEQGEKRKDAQLAREFIVSLPRELTLEQNTLLTKEFVQQELVNRGMVADISIHTDRAHDGEPQPHAHILLTMREVSAEGFGQKVRAWNDKALLLEWREAWAETTNRHLALNGHDLRIDHRSFADQGIELEPQHKIGATEARAKMAAIEDHARIARENGERILNNPDIALDALTRQQSTFTHHDLARFINRQTVDAEQFQLVYDKVISSPELVLLGQDEVGRDRLTTQTMLSLEQEMMQRIVIIADQSGHAINEANIQHIAESKTLSEEQTKVLNYITAEGNLKTLIGYAGTGKSHLLSAAKELWEEKGYRVTGLTLSGIAAESLEGSSGIASRTFASYNYYWERGEQHLTSRDVLVVDEAGMLGSREFAKIVQEVDRAGAKVVWSGDVQQFQAIGAGAPLRATIERTSFIELTEVRRQQVDWQKEATQEFANGKVTEAMTRYHEANHVHEFKTQDEAKQTLIAQWNDVRISSPEKTQIILAYTRKEAHELNLLAREIRQSLGELGIDQAIHTERGIRQMAVGDRVYFLKNDKALDVKNGSLGTIQRIDETAMLVRLDKGDSKGQAREVYFDTRKYNHLDYGYAATMHKAQAVTVDCTYVLSSKYMDAHATYVSMTRHRYAADLFWSREVFTHSKDLMAALSKDRSKDVTLDYVDHRAQQKEFARHYGIESNIESYPDKTKTPVRKFTTPEQEKQQHKTPDFTKKDDLQAFKARFEQQHPEKANELKHRLMPDYEKRALSAMDRFGQLEKKVLEFKGKSNEPFHQKQLEKYAHDLAKKEPKIMAYLEKNNEPMAKQMQQLSVSYEKGLNRGRER